MRLHINRPKFQHTDSRCLYGNHAILISTHAQAAPDCVMAAMVESAKEVVPVDSGSFSEIAGARDAAAEHHVHVVNPRVEQLWGLLDLKHRGGRHPFGEGGFRLGNGWR